MKMMVVIELGNTEETMLYPLGAKECGSQEKSVQLPGNYSAAFPSGTNLRGQ